MYLLSDSYLLTFQWVPMQNPGGGGSLAALAGNGTVKGLCICQHLEPPTCPNEILKGKNRASETAGMPDISHTVKQSLQDRVGKKCLQCFLMNNPKVFVMNLFCRQFIHVRN